MGREWKSEYRNPKSETNSNAAMTEIQNIVNQTPKRSKDPLTAATTSVLKPALTSLGFQGRGSRDFVRINDGVLQLINLQLQAYGSKDFCVNYSATTLYEPKD
jgi:hypothetical protein